MVELLQKSEQAFALGGITTLELLDTRKTYRDFISKYNQTLAQSALNKDLLTIYTGQIAGQVTGQSIGQASGQAKPGDTK
jgi:hypothetical protein